MAFKGGQRRRKNGVVASAISLARSLSASGQAFKDSGQKLAGTMVKNTSDTIKIKGIWDSGEVFIGDPPLSLKESLKSYPRSPVGFSWSYKGAAGPRAAHVRTASEVHG